MAIQHAKRRRIRMIVLSSLAAAGVGALLTLVPHTDAAANADRLNPSERLNPGERLVSGNGQYVVTMQGDGNLVEYAPGNRVIWATGTNGPNSVAVQQADGNLVVVAPGNLAVRSTGTQGNPGATLEVQNDGTSWCTHPATSPAGPDALRRVDRLSRGLDQR